MIFLFVAPFGAGLGNYLIPLQIGAPDMAFPRLNALSYWCFAGGGLLVLLSGFAAAGGGTATGWYRVPAAVGGAPTRPRSATDLWILGLALVAMATLLTGVNILTTVFLMRAPGMTMWRVPDLHLEHGRHVDPRARRVPARGGRVRAAARGPPARRARVRPAWAGAIP